MPHHTVLVNTRTATSSVMDGMFSRHSAHDSIWLNDIYCTDCTKRLVQLASIALNWVTTLINNCSPSV